MTREEAKEWIPLLQAYADGAEIENEEGGLDDVVMVYSHEIELGYEVHRHKFSIKPQDHNHSREKSKYGEYKDFLKKRGIDPEEMRESMESRLRRCDMCVHHYGCTQAYYCSTCDVRTRDKWEYKK